MKHRSRHRHYFDADLSITQAHMLTWLAVGWLGWWTQIQLRIWSVFGASPINPMPEALGQYRPLPGHSYSLVEAFFFITCLSIAILIPTALHFTRPLPRSSRVAARLWLATMAAVAFSLSGLIASSEASLIEKLKAHRISCEKEYPKHAERIQTALEEHARACQP